MATTNVSVHVHRSQPARSAVQAHKLTAGILTAVGIAIAVMLTALFGGVGLFSAAISLSLPLLLIWGASDVTRADEND